MSSGGSDRACSSTAWKWIKALGISDVQFAASSKEMMAEASMSFFFFLSLVTNVGPANYARRRTGKLTHPHLRQLYSPF